MMKIFLTSTGLLPRNKNIRAAFLALLEKKISDIKVAFIPTASRTEHEQSYVEESKQELLELGIKKENIIVFNLDQKKVGQDAFIDFDLIYICGGNTFYLLKHVRESGFDVALRNFRGIYFGVSAGTVLAGPNVEIAAPFDDRVEGVTNFIGLNLVDVAIIPHFSEKKRGIVQELKRKALYKIETITDNQVLVFDSGKMQLVEN